MKFIADVMLGRLAKRLRLLGFDVLYDRTLDDNGVIRISIEQERMILTRDIALAARPLARNHLVIRDDKIGQQVDQVISAFPSQMVPAPLTRCSECNELLNPISRQDAQNLVPAFVHEKNRDFLRCPGCGRTYWQGTHVKRMMLPKIK
jgi:uncharacterized protein with PIN domain